MTAMKYANLLEVAEAVFDGRVRFLDAQTVGPITQKVLEYWNQDEALTFPGWEGMDGDGHRMWFCLFVWEATK